MHALCYRDGIVPHCLGFKALVARIHAGDPAIPSLLLSALSRWSSNGTVLQLEVLEARIFAFARSDERMRRLQQIPGVGPLIAHALVMASAMRAASTPRATVPPGSA